MVKKTVLCVGLLVIAQLALAQQDYFENTIEFGPAAGGCFYIGDANRIPFAHLQPAFGGVLRVPFNTRLALKGIASMEQIAGGYTYYSFIQNAPYYRTQERSISGTLVSAGLHVEFNFFPYEQTDFTLESSKITPYILAGGGGVAWSKASAAPVVTFGVGGKLKLSRYFNLSLEWTINKAFTDNLEKTQALNNPYSLNRSKLYNNDYYSSITLALTFSIYPKPCDCKNEH